jgi:2-hydroxyacyl-CoA lyase 1
VIPVLTSFRRINSNLKVKMASPQSPTGAQIITRTLRDLGVTVVFGLVGVPVTDIAEECINLGIKFIGFRNEQAAAYAATGFGYLTGKPGVLLLVGGPGVLHGMAGVCSFPFLLVTMVMILA